MALGRIVGFARYDGQMIGGRVKKNNNNMQYQQQQKYSLKTKEKRGYIHIIHDIKMNVKYYNI